MKRSLFAGLLAVTAQAQQMKVMVCSDREPLAYAYVYVNERAAAVTDTLGVAQLPTANLQAGDTISASYVGTTPDLPGQGGI